MNKFLQILPRGVSTGTKRKINEKRIAQNTPNKKTKIFSDQVQSYIDLGQRSFGKKENCPLCGMVFIIGDKDDESGHKRYCSTISKEIRFSRSFVDHLFKKSHSILPSDSEKGFIVAIVPTKVKSDSVQALFKKISDDLGGCQSFLFECNSKNQQPLVLVYLSSQLHVLGCLISEKIGLNQLTRIGPNESCSTVASHSSILKNSIFGQDELGGSCQASDTITGITLGVRLIWVSVESRHRGLATELVDEARKRIIYGSVIPKAEVAFSQPTTEGLAFVRSYIYPTRNVLAYT